jgi:phosphohistidine phosphatase
MNLYILRHASAGVRRANPLLDVKRPLDKEGKQHCLHLAHVLNALKINFDQIISSPLKRALQTAQLVATETGYEAKILRSDALAPTAEYAEFLHLLDDSSERENILVVGHNPNLTVFLGLLLARMHANASATAPPQIRLRKGSLARLTYVRGNATLLSLIDPRLVRALYSTSTKSSRRKTSRK